MFITEEDSVATGELFETDEDSVEVSDCIVVDEFTNKFNDEVVEVEAAVVFSVVFTASLCCSVTTVGDAAAEDVDEELSVVATDCTDEDSVDATEATSVTACVTLLTVDCVGLVTGLDT